jgi:hypothetical protein
VVDHHPPGTDAGSRSASLVLIRRGGPAAREPERSADVGIGHRFHITDRRMDSGNGICRVKMRRREVQTSRRRDLPQGGGHAMERDERLELPCAA